MQVAYDLAQARRGESKIKVRCQYSPAERHGTTSEQRSV
jgi:hypothetical protein